MTDPIEYTEELEPLLSLALPSGWVRGLIQHPLQAVSGEPTAIDRLFAQDLSPERLEEPIATQLLFVYLRGYEPSNERPMRSDRRVTVGYFPSTDQFGVQSLDDQYRVASVDGVTEWLTEAIPQVELEVDAWNQLWGVLSEIHGLGPAGINNLHEEYGTLETVGTATESELSDIAYITADLAPEILAACEQWDGSIPEAPGDRVAKDADDPLVIDRSDLRPLSHIFEN
jgi:hypothetical protein